MNHSQKNPEPSDLAIEVRGLSKTFQVYSTPAQRLWAMVFHRSQERPTRIEPVRDIDLAVHRGETYGLIGLNGSGKTTLLRLIAGALDPTAGEITVRGRLSSMIELNAGFNPNLTGRENVVTKCRLLGLEEAEIGRRLEAIIDFSTLRDHIDRPIRIYSAGMLARLGFALTINLDFDILVVDEILAVGDLTFQQACLEAIRELKNRGRTILLSSHNLGELGSICHRVGLMENGRLGLQGEPEVVLKRYLEHCDELSGRIPGLDRMLDVNRPEEADRGRVRIVSVSFTDAAGEEREVFDSGQEMNLVLTLEATAPVENPLVRVQFFRNDGLWISGTNNFRHGLGLGRLNGRTTLQVTLGAVNLLEGDYYVSVGVWPDECVSLLARRPLALLDKRFIIRVRSRRTDGGGLIRHDYRWQRLA